MVPALWQVEEWIAEAASQPIEAFFPSAVAKDLGLSQEEVVEALLKLDDTGKLIREWVITCSDVDCGGLLFLSASELPLPGETLVCPRCGEEYEYEPQFAQVRFRFTPEYKAVKKKRQDPIRGGLKWLYRGRVLSNQQRLTAAR